MNELVGKKVLDMGCGSGIIGVVAALKKANVMAVDINIEAVKCTLQNFEQNGISAEVKQSDIFNELDSSKKFDIILFNPPYYKYEPRNDFERGFGGGKDYKVIRKFVSDSKKFLAKDGFLCMIISSDMGIDQMTAILAENGYNYKILQQIDKFFETFFIVKGFLINT